MTTALDIISRSLRDIGIIDAIEIPSDEDAQQGLVYLNDLLESLSNEGLDIYKQTQSSLTCTGALSYTVGEWADVSYSGTGSLKFINSSSFSINTTSDQSATFPVGAYIRVYDGVSYKYGTIASSSSSTAGTLLTVACGWDSPLYAGISQLSYISGTSFSVATLTNKTATYPVGTYIRVYDGAAYHYGTISSVSDNGTGTLLTITAVGLGLTGAFTGTPTLSLNDLNIVATFGSADYSGAALTRTGATTFTVVTTTSQIAAYPAGTYIKVFDGATTQYGVVSSATDNGAGTLLTITASGLNLTGAFTGTPALSTGGFTGTPTVALSGKLYQVRPIVPTSAYYSLSGVDYPVEIINLEQYNSIPYKNVVGGIPYCIAFNTDVPLSTMYIYPAPSSGTLNLVSQNPLTAAALLTTVLAFPVGYERMVRLLLGVELMPSYGVQNQQIVAMAEKAKRDIKRINYKPATLDVTLTMGRYRTRGNILNGAY